MERSQKETLISFHLTIVLQQTIDKVFLNIKQELDSVTDTPIQSKVKSPQKKKNNNN